MIITPQTTRDAHETIRAPRCDDQGNLCVFPPANGLPTQFFLTTAGDGTGSNNFVGDYSAASIDAKFTAPYEYFIFSVLGVVADNANFTLTDYGGGTPLTNGVKFFIRPDGNSSVIPLLGGRSFKTNADWLSITAHTTLTTFAGLSQALTIEFELTNDYGCPLKLGVGGEFIVRFNDNFTNLVTHTFGIRGTRYASAA